MESNTEEPVDVVAKEIAKVLFEHWQKSDFELNLVWEELDPENQIYKVFIKQGRALEKAGFSR